MINHIVIAVFALMALPSVVSANRRPENTSVSLDSKGGIAGYWWWTWSGSGSSPAGTNLGVAFSGWADINNALSESANVMWKLPGEKYLSVGGGNGNGRFTWNNIQSITDAIYQGRLSGYQGIVYDIEEGDSGLQGQFEKSFAAARSKGLKVLVTVSHSAPYGIADAASLMRSFFRNSNINIISPQLYTSGTETWNDYSTVYGVEFREYANSIAQVVPSVTYSWLYNDAKNYFASQGVTIQGYIQWAQV